jgi:hypothetical protein
LARYIAEKTGFLAKAARLAQKGRWARLRRLCVREYGGSRAWEKRTRGAQKGLSAGALEWTYAVAPTVSDVTTAVGLFNGSLTKYGTEFAVISTAGKYDREYPGDGVLTDKANCEYLFSAKAVYVIDSAALAALALLGITDVPGTAWELVRWSFLVDWLIPVGDWCSSMTPLFGLNLIDSYVGCKITETHIQAKRSWRPAGAPSAAAVKFQLPPTTLNGSFRKQLNPRAHLILKNPFSLSHMVTTAALIRQLT